MLRQKYLLSLLLKIANLARSTYYYYSSKVDPDLKNDAIMNLIIEIYYENKGRYGYRRITLELRNRGYQVNHKKVLRLMNKMGLYSIIRRKRKYSSYKGNVGKVANNLIKRNFEAKKANEKCFTDVTEFNVRGEKLYFSLILDAYERFIVSYSTSQNPNLFQIKEMLDKGFEDQLRFENLIIHSDQGWQYQHKFFVKSLEDKRIKQSMSRKGNSIDNGLMESFFGIMKSEMFYDQEEQYETMEDLKQAIDEYIDYSNHRRIKSKLKGLTPAEYRNQSFYENS